MKIYKFMRSWFTFQAPELSCVQLTWDVLENPSQAARQGIAVLMATAEVVLKHETSTTYQSHIYESIDLKFG